MSLEPCPVEGCTRTVWAKGLCLHHYKRQRAGKPLESSGPRIGDPSGFGRYGLVERTETGALCHECGHWFASVGAHAAIAHGLPARDYRLRHGIPLGQPLVSLARSARASEVARAKVGTAAWRRLEEARDPEAAHRARTAESFVRRDAGAAEVARANGRRVEAREHPCLGCGRMLTGKRRTCSDECLRQVRARNASNQ